ncbi:MAG TPA: ATP-binding protein [Planctomycetota bacterium]|nr:ATP-binding protein [Planctomycetota bacterium]
MHLNRYLADAIHNDALARRKMAFISGPRQVGKSTLAKSLLSGEENYFLYDEETFRRAWAKSPGQAIAQRSPGTIVLDEIHKDRRWKTKLKGIADARPADLQIIVTGSARLDHYRRGSDSLLGRYLPYRLFPFSVAETGSPPAPDDALTTRQVSHRWADLLRLGGFPEPLLGGSENEALRWSRLRLDRLVLEDSRDFLNISDLNAFRTLIDLLPERVGSLLSVNSLREDVGKAYATVRSWMEVLDLLYYSFTIRPYAKRLARALKAEPKLYLFDILRIPVEHTAKRLENLVALHLLKACCFWTDTARGEFELRYIRDKEKREVDFLVLRDDKPWMMVECKSSQKEPARELVHFGAILKPLHRFQLVTDEDHDRSHAETRVRVLGYERFLSGLI